MISFLAKLFGAQPPTPAPVSPSRIVTPQTVRENVKTSAPLPVHELAAAAAEPANTVWKLDPRSEANIATLLPYVRPKAALLLQLLAASSINAKIISATRTYAEQNELYRQGRSKPGPVVTKAPAGFSNHNFGVAFDIGIFQNGKYLDDSPLYRQAGRIGRSLGFTWGGDWKSIQDEPHFELHPAWVTDQALSENEMLAAFRARKAKGQDLA